MTRKKPVRVPTDEDVIRIFTGQPFKRFLGANLPADANVEGFAAGALAGAKVFIRDAVIEKQHKTTKERPLMSPRGEAALAFVMGLEMDYLLATGEMPPFTASRTRRGPFARIVHECFSLLNVAIDDVDLINKLQRRSHTINDKKGQPRRQQKKVN